MSNVIASDATVSDPSATTTEVPSGTASPSRLRHLAGTAFLLVVLDLGVSFPHVLAARALALAIVLFLPGALLMGTAGVRFASRYVEIAAVLAASLAVIIAWAAISSALLPHLGVAKPLSRVPLAIAINLISAGLAILSHYQSDPVLDQFQGKAVRRLQPWHVSLLLPLLAVGGVERLNDGHGSALVQVAMGAAAVALILGFIEARAGRHLPAQVLLFSAALALIYLYSYRGTNLFGYDIQQEYQRFLHTFAESRWSPPAGGDPYASMLSITALPAALAKLTSISGLYLFKGLFPVFLAFVPGLAYEVAVRWLPGRAAFIGAAYMVVLPDFASQLPAIARQETAFFFFALLIVVLFAPELGVRRKQAAVGVLLAALVVSHYSTSYVAVVMLASTWVVYTLLRLLTVRRRRGPLAAPAVSLFTVLLGVAMVLAWDVGITNSSSNVTNFLSSVVDKGVKILPYNKGGSILNRYLNGNIGQPTTPAEYYARVKQASLASQPWLNTFPASVTDKYPAQPAPPAPRLPALVPNSASLINSVVTAFDEAFLALIIIGVALTLFHRRVRPPPVPLEVAILGLALLGFLAVIRVSGTVAGSYNADRAQLQAAIVLAVALGLAAEWIMKHLRLGWLPLVAAVLAILFNGIGETDVVSGGDPPVLLANAGTGYDYFVISDGELSAAAWLADQSDHRPLIYTDDYGVLRLPATPPNAPTPQTWLTPATLSLSAWVYTPAYAVLDNRAYGSVDGNSTTYRFPTPFLRSVDNLVYSNPTAAVYQ